MPNQWRPMQMDDLREKVVREIARSHGAEWDLGYGRSNQDRFLMDADRILAIPEIARALHVPTRST